MIASRHEMQAIVGLTETSEKTDSAFMRAALDVARQAVTAGEVPIGAVLVRQAKIVASAHNAPISFNDPTAHAEILVLRQAAHAAGNYRLLGTTLYVTAEPCLMCVGALVHARIRRVVFGCTDPKGGALGSTYDLAAKPASNHRFDVTQGVCAHEASALLRAFFRMRRGA